MQDYSRVSSIAQHDSRSLAVHWTDGRESIYDVVKLRRLCPCALCIDEMSGRRKLQESDIPESVRPTSIRSVGRYALSIGFSDGHTTGIYTFSFLRKLDAPGNVQ